MSASGAAAGRWADAMQALAIFTVDRAGTGGVALHALPGPVRDRWLGHLKELLPAGTPIRRLPLHIADDRLLGGLDLAATLAAGRPVAQRGLLAEADGGVVVAAMAERLASGTAARLSAVLDAGQVTVEREGLAMARPARLGLVALDEGMGEDERTPATLRERLAFHLELDGVGIAESIDGPATPEVVLAARSILPRVVAGPEIVEVLSATASLLGIGSLRAPLLALRVARIAAALDGRLEVAAEDAALAGRLVLAPRATMVPETGQEESQPEPQDPTSASEPTESPDSEPSIEDLVLAAARAAIPRGLLERLKSGDAGAVRGSPPGSAGQARPSALRGRPSGIRAGEPRQGARLSLVATLRAAAPWQPLRRPAGSTRIEIRREDFRVARYRQRTRSTVIFVVDASGSAALHRLAEAKGAVELLLADCYVRRDRVALVSFRGRGPDLLLAPTRSLARARRCLAELPGGGGTPLASAIDAALALADTVRRRGETPTLVLLTDGRGNIGRDGEPGRPRAEADALAAARLVRSAGVASLLIDTSPQPRPQGGQIAAAMGATYLPLPHADAAMLSRAIRDTTLAPQAGGKAPR